MAFVRYVQAFISGTALLTSTHAKSACEEKEVDIANVGRYRLS